MDHGVGVKTAPDKDKVIADDKDKVKNCEKVKRRG